MLHLSFQVLVVFFRFPSKPIRRRQWVQSMKREDKDKVWEPNKYDCLCSEHFTAKDFRQTKTRQLFSNAVPSVFSFKTIAKESSRSVRYIESYGQVPILILQHREMQMKETKSKSRGSRKLDENYAMSNSVKSDWENVAKMYNLSGSTYSRPRLTRQIILRSEWTLFSFAWTRNFSCPICL